MLGVEVDGIVEGIIAISVFVGALTVIAAAGSKPPFSWVGHWIAWVFRRLVGNPVRDYISDIVRVEMQGTLTDNGLGNEEP